MLGEFLNAVSAVVVLLMLMAVGYFMGTKGWMKAEEKKFLSKYIINIAVPCNCINGLLNNLDQSMLAQAGLMLVSAIIGVVITILLGMGLATLLRLPKNRWGVFAAMVGVSNTLFVGLPLSTQLFGDVCVPYVMMYYLANTLFVQSHVPAHAELGWVLNCYTMFGELSRMTQFKDKSAKHKDNINGGLFTYPALMAADILLYQPDYVPVGSDQKQHVELCRDVATRFNNIYGDVFKIPEPYIPKIGARVMSLAAPENKMSKSDKDPNGTVYLLDRPEDIMRKFKKAVTDSDTERCVRYDLANKPGVSNLMSIYSACTGKTFEEIEAEFDGKGYGAFKPAVGEAVVETLRPIREESERLLKDKAYLESVYKAGAEKASYIANKTLRKVYKKVGFVAK